MGSTIYVKEGETFEEFFSRIVKREGKGRKKFKISGSWGIYDAYKLLRKHKWLNIGRPLKEHEFYSIIRGVNDCIAEEIANGKTITFPARMGKIELRKFPMEVKIVDGKLKIGNPVNWHDTIRLWYEDEEARRDKLLIRNTCKYKHKVLYKKYTANYQNKMFYEFELNRFIKEKLRQNIKEGKTEAIW